MHIGPIRVGESFISWAVGGADTPVDAIVRHACGMRAACGYCSRSEIPISGREVRISGLCRVNSSPILAMAKLVMMGGKRSDGCYSRRTTDSAPSWHVGVWYDTYDTICYGMVWYVIVWYGMVWYGMVWYGMVWYGMVWYDMVWYGMVWYGMVWYDMIWYLVWNYTSNWW